MAAGAHIRIDQATNPVPTGTYDQGRDDVRQAVQVQLVGDANSGGNVSPQWTLLDKPPGATASIASGSTFAATLTGDLPGPYRVQLLVNDGLAANGQIKVFRVTADSNGNAIDNGICPPAYGELASEGNAGGNARGYSVLYEAMLAATTPVVSFCRDLRTKVPNRHKRVHALYHDTTGDAGGGVFRWNASSTAPDNDGTIYTPAGVTTGRWEREYSGNAYHATWFGVKADGFYLTTASRTAAGANLTNGAAVFSAVMVGRKAVVREPSSIAAGTLTIAGGGSPVAQGTSTNVAVALPKIANEVAAVYQPASGGCIYVNGSYYAVLYVDPSTQQLTLFQASPTQTTQAWYTDTQTVTTVSAFNSTTSLALAASATVTQSGNVQAFIATDDTTAWDNAISACFLNKICELIAPSGYSGVSSNLGYTSKSNLTIRWPNPEGSALVDLRKVSSETPYPNATNYYGVLSFYLCDAIHIVGGSYDGSVPVLGCVHSAGGSVNNSGSRSGFTMLACTNSSFEDCRSVGFGARDEHLYVQGASPNFLFDRCRVVGNNNVSINFNGSGTGDDDVRVTGCWATGILLGSASFLVDACHITTLNHPRLVGGVTLANIGHGTLSNCQIHDINMQTAGTSLIDVFGGNLLDSSLSIIHNKMFRCNGLWDSGHGAPIHINNHGGTVLIEHNVVDKCAGYPSNARFIHVEGASLGQTIIGPNTLRGRTGCNMTIGIETSGVPAGSVTIKAGTYFGESITTKWILSAAVNTVSDLGGTADGTALTDADQTLTVTGGNKYVQQEATLTANRTKTLGTTGSPVAAEIIVIERRDGTNKTIAVVNGGGGGGTLYTFPASVKRKATFKYDGTNWALDRNERIN